MTKQIDINEALGIKLEGTPEDGQRVIESAVNSLKKLFGAETPEMANALLRHCFKVLKPIESSDNHSGSDERMFLVAAVSEIKPRDGVERLLSVQMAATHVALVRAGRWMATADNLAQSLAHTNGFNKLARTYTTQMEALRKHRNGGKQTVTVQHVNVEDGGKAIVGNVQTGEGHT
jgi:hypothetical protein